MKNKRIYLVRDSQMLVKQSYVTFVILTLEISNLFHWEASTI